MGRPGPFTDNPIRPGSTPVGAIHFAELRTRNDALQRSASLAPFAWTDTVLTPGVTPVRLAHLAALQDGELGRVTLVALQPRGWVRPHVDAGAYYRIRDRFHLVLKSREGSPLTPEGETVVMREGELWAFDNKAGHDARNPTDEARVHLIFDVLPAAGRGYYVRPLV